MSDAMDETEPPIVDCDVLEAAKENIQPLASGRRVTALSAILSTPHAQRESRLAAARNRHRINVEVALEDDDDDPLEAYCRFVYWTVENYPQGHSAESGLLELLEEATRVLKDNSGGKWRGDMRYLKLWVLYASYVEKPAIVFKFCMVNEIGTSHALLYEAYATVLERAGRRTEADEVYLLGIARRATPLEQLESRHREFQKRMMSSITLPLAASEPPTSSSTSSRRQALSETASSTRTRVTRSGSTRSPTVPQDVFSAPPPSTTLPHSNARLQIFVDPSGTGAAEAQGNSSSTAPWPELGTRKSRVKENIPEVKKAAGTTLRQTGRAQRVAAAPSGSRIAVYRDPEPGSIDEGEEMPSPSATVPREKTKSKIVVFRDDESAADGATNGPMSPTTPTFVPYRDEELGTPSSSSAVPSSVIKVKAIGSRKEGPGTTESEALRKDPFKNYEAFEKPSES
ncbi:uncharacterized protein FIBRA_01628 [Fibroporia radiculosa]|uniref:BUB1 N-terminal domain-containing protein n=1 Tax=Fibroporia radiculosa TaxID=599839 RepID=J4GKU2_9APHY|nr:uncharacterized protein FIBRA_01628 [Fibroporia radiculosa]CCL99610.1 predicted protein [Fibroporia radiculosa]